MTSQNKRNKVFIFQKIKKYLKVPCVAQKINQAGVLIPNIVIF